VSSGPNTPTPRPNENGIISKPAPSVTPLPVTRIVDLAQGLDDKDKVYVYVMRCNGTFELFLVRPNTTFSEAVVLQPGDVILDWISPASLMGKQPPRTTPASVITPTQEVRSYPPPGTSPTPGLTPYP
jgi:hypothetical protein